MDKYAASASVDAFHRMGAKVAFIEFSLMPLLLLRGRWLPRPAVPTRLRDLDGLVALHDETLDTIASTLAVGLIAPTAELVQLARREAAILPEGVFEEWNAAAKSLSASEARGTLQTVRHLLTGNTLAAWGLGGTERGNAYAFGRLSSRLSLVRARMGLWRSLTAQGSPQVLAPWHPWSVAAGIAGPLADAEKVLEEIVQVTGPASLRGVAAMIETAAPSWPARPDVRERVRDGAANLQSVLAHASLDVDRLLHLVEMLLQELAAPGYGDVNDPVTTFQS